MKCVRIMELLAMASAVLMAFAASASATTVTSPTGTLYTDIIHAEAGQTTFHGVVTVSCTSSTVTASISTHSSTSTAHGGVTTLKFNECTDGNHVTVETNGTLEAHTDPESPSTTNATVTSSGATITVHVTSLGLTCGYRTEETHIGTLTSSHNTGGHAILDVDSVAISRHAGSFFCGSTGEWTATYTITTPSTFYID
jgi:hypothetical protein